MLGSIELKKPGKRNIIFLTMTLIWLGLIFSFSAKPANESSKESAKVGRLVCSIFVPGFNEMPEDQKLDLAEAIDYPVRKAAHGTEYAILGMLLVGTLYGIVIINDVNRYSIPSFVFGVLYAASDEFHQLFVPGRSGNAVDVCIDSIGLLTGILLVNCILYIYNRYKKRRQY